MLITSYILIKVRMSFELSGEGPFLLIINKQYSSKLNRITIVLAEEVDESKFSKQVLGWIKSIL